METQHTASMTPARARITNNANDKERTMAETAQAATPEEVAAAYFKVWKDGDIDSVRPLLHSEVDFLGAMGATRGLEETLLG